MEIDPLIIRPTLIVDRQRVLANIRRMNSKAALQNIRFRPHFKTHQSAAVGEWFRAEGVDTITVSSVEMAEYFAAHGWDDITIAFSLNLRELPAVDRLAKRIRLGVLVESEQAVAALKDELSIGVDVWIKVDTGAGRTGLGWQQVEKLEAVASSVRSSSLLNLRGLLTHAGHTYRALPTDVCQIYSESVAHLDHLRAHLQNGFNHSLEISVGDTPGSTLCTDWGSIDEARPGNFVFYDAQQLAAGVCQPEQVAAVVACPVVAVHPERNEVVIYGGAIHFTKDLVVKDGKPVHGLVCPLESNGWGDPLPDAALVRLSQEHGIVSLPPEALAHVRVGDLLAVMPAHVCLTVSALGRYLTLDGDWIETIPRFFKA